MNAFDFIKNAMDFAGTVDLSDDDSWRLFMTRVFEYIVMNITPLSQMHAFIIAEGGDSTIQNIVMSYLPTNYQLDGENSKPSKFNTAYSDETLREIEKIMNIHGAEGVNFAIDAAKPQWYLWSI